MNILAIETSSRIGSLSVRAGESERCWIGEAGEVRSQDLLPRIEMLLGESCLNKRELNLVAVSAGPGSFTGLRVGHSVARGLAFALGIGCFGVSMPECLAVCANLESCDRAEVVSLIPLAQKNWCRQLFKGSGFKMEAQSEIIIKSSEEIFRNIREEEETLFAVDAETFERFFQNPGDDWRNVISVGQNLASWVGLIAKEKMLLPGVRSDVLPNYLL